MKKIFALFLVLCAALVFQGQPEKAHAYNPYANYYGDEFSIPIMYYILDNEPCEFPLKAYKADVDIVGNIASVKLTQTFVNTSKEKIDAIYRFPGSTQAAVHGMTMKIKDRVIYAQIQEKQEARQTYEIAKSEGKRASLLSQERPNVFTTEVANIYPGDTIQVIVDYSEIITYKDYTYSLVLPTKIGERYQGMYEKTGTRGEYDVFENVYAGKAIDFDINVNISSIFDIANVYSKTHQIKKDEKDGKTLVKMDTPTPLDRDFILNYEMESQKVETGLMIHEGEDENFFLLMLQAPRRVPAEEILPREYVFVVDVSGSMNGKPIQTAIELYGNLLEGTNETDMFNVIKFAGSNEVLAEKSMPATIDNLQKGFDFLSNERGGGGTELLPALKRAIDLPKTDGYSRSVILITDGFITADIDVIEYVSQNLDKGNIFPFGIGTSVNRYLIEGLSNLSMSEPFIISNMDDALSEAKKFKEYIDSPVMTDIKIEFENFDAYDLVPEKIPDVFAQRPIIISGKYKGHPSGIVRVSGLNGKQEMKTYFQVERFAELDTSQTLKYLWARRKLQTIQDFPGVYHYVRQDRNKEEIINLGLKYHLMTNHTSFVAVDTEVIEQEENQVEEPDSKLQMSKNEYSSKGTVFTKMATNPAPGTAKCVVVAERAKVSSTGSGVSVRGARASDRQIIIDGMDLSNKFTGGMGIGGSKYYPMKSDINSGYGNIVVGDAKGNFLDKIDFGSSGTVVQSYPIRDGKLDESFNVGDTVILDIDDLRYKNVSSVDDLKALEEVFIKYLGLSPFTWNNYNIEFLVDKNDNLCLIELPVGSFTEVKDMQAFIKEIIETIADELDNPQANTIYGASIKLNPSGKFNLEGIDYETAFEQNLFWRESIDDMTMIKDGRTYTLYFEIWDKDKKLVAKGTIDNLTNETNPFVRNLRGNISIPQDKFCMHYAQLQNSIKLGDEDLKQNENYYIKLKGVMSEAGNE